MIGVIYHILVENTNTHPNLPVIVMRHLLGSRFAIMVKSCYEWELAKQQGRAKSERR